MTSLTLLTCYLTLISVPSTLTSTVSPTASTWETSDYVSLESHVTETNLSPRPSQITVNNVDSTSLSHSSKNYLSFAGASIQTTTVKPSFNNTAPLQSMFNGLQNTSILLHNRLMITLNVTNITTGCENITNTTNYPNKSTTVQTPTTSRPSNASQSSRAPSPSSYSYYTPSSVTPTYSTAASLTPACNVTTIFQMANITYSFDPVHTEGLRFIIFPEQSPFVIILKELDHPQEVEDTRPNVTHQGFCQQFSSHLEHEKHFNFSSSFNRTHSVVSLDRCQNDTSVIIFENIQTWYKYPQGPFLYALEKILYYYGFNRHLVKFTALLDDHKCKFDVRSRVQYSKDGEYYSHYNNRHATSWGVCNNFYQHVNNITLSGKSQ
uniref:Ser/thr-rich glycoprotein ORF-O n=1 Tax=Elephant endotheliotropic herpesvirus 1A TaxID=759753 RepID=A0A455LHP9_ELHV1|nr:ser/thr-rich glycoprotein ORF-O [Elephant endotheliotropic herpesvirus 1A]QBP78451.1 ser/thr-rich glycoprotein ORF-O [Elephant endotheliotropic herpesvirus 1A]